MLHRCNLVLGEIHCSDLICRLGVEDVRQFGELVAGEVNFLCLSIVCKEITLLVTRQGGQFIVARHELHEELVLAERSSEALQSAALDDQDGKTRDVAQIRHIVNPLVREIQKLYRLACRPVVDG